MLVGVFGMPAQLDAGTLSVDGCGWFLHGVKVKKKPRQLALSGLMSEALRRSERMGEDKKKPAPTEASAGNQNRTHATNVAIFVRN